MRLGALFLKIQDSGAKIMLLAHTPIHTVEAGRLDARLSFTGERDAAVRRS
jgi:hypothetical protein